MTKRRAKPKQGQRSSDPVSDDSRGGSTIWGEPWWNLVELQFTALERKYVASRSPVYAFEARRVAREHGRELPAWASEYFDRVDAAIERLADEVRVTKRDMPPERLAQAFEFNSPGRGTAWIKMLDVEKEIQRSDTVSGICADKRISRRKALDSLIEPYEPGTITPDDADRRDKRVDAAERRMNRILKPLRDFLGLDKSSP